MQMFQVEEKDGVNERLVMETDYRKARWVWVSVLLVSLLEEFGKFAFPRMNLVNLDRHINNQIINSKLFTDRMEKPDQAFWSVTSLITQARRRQQQKDDDSQLDFQRGLYTLLYHVMTDTLDLLHLFMGLLRMYNVRYPKESLKKNIVQQ